MSSRMKATWCSAICRPRQRRSTAMRRTVAERATERKSLRRPAPSAGLDLSPLPRGPREPRIAVPQKKLQLVDLQLLGRTVALLRPPGEPGTGQPFLMEPESLAVVDTDLD